MSARPAGCATMGEGVALPIDRGEIGRLYAGPDFAMNRAFCVARSGDRARDCCPLEARGWLPPLDFRAFRGLERTILARQAATRVRRAGVSDEGRRKMYERDFGALPHLRSLIERYGRRVVMMVLGAPVCAAILTGGFVPGALDYTVLLGVVVRRCGLVRTLLMVMSLFVLAAAAIPKTCGSREKAYTAAMKSDLKNLASQEEIYYSDNYAYSASPSELAFVNSDGVTVTIVAGRYWWAASATHAALGTAEGCAIYYGASPSARAALDGLAPVIPGEPGRVVCTE